MSTCWRRRVVDAVAAVSGVENRDVAVDPRGAHRDWDDDVAPFAVDVAVENDVVASG